MSFDFILETAKANNLVYTIEDYEAYFIPIGKNYFTRVRNLETDYYIEYCDDYKKPLDNQVIVVRRRNDTPIGQDVVIVHHILAHPKNKPDYTYFKTCIKLLEAKHIICDVEENQAFCSMEDTNYFTKLTAGTDKIIVEYCNENFVLLGLRTFILNDGDYKTMADTLEELVKSHPYSQK
jgi:hypothetical protein